MGWTCLQLKKLSIPYFLLQSLIECSTKLNVVVPDQLAHHGLIKLLVEDALHTYTIPIAWEIFRNMSKDDNIRTLAENITPSNSKEGQKTKEIEKDSDEGAQDIQAEGKTDEEQKEKEEFCKTAEPKTAKDKTAKMEKGGKEKGWDEKGQESPKK